MCVYMFVYVFSVLFCHDPSYLLPPKFAVIFSPEGAFWLLSISQCYIIGDCQKDSVYFHHFHRGNL